MSIAAQNICKSYGESKVLDAVSVYCDPGEIVGVLGLNGAGKSTLFKILLGLISPDRGAIHSEISHVKPLGGIIEKPALYEYLNAAENLKIFGSIQGADISKIAISQYLEMVGLDPVRSDKVGNYSMGMKQRLAIAIALLNDPPFLVLDEPFSGLDPVGVIRLRNLIRDLAKKNGIGVLVSSHLVDEMIRTCDRIYVINKGKIIREDAPFELIGKATRSYVLTGDALNASKVLQAHGAEFEGSHVRITDPKPGISEIIKQLGVEGATVYSCVPETDINRLLEYEH